MKNKKIINYIEWLYIISICAFVFGLIGIVLSGISLEKLKNKADRICEMEISYNTYDGTEWCFLDAPEICGIDCGNGTLFYEDDLRKCVIINEKEVCTIK